MATRYVCDECGLECTPVCQGRCATLPLSRGEICATVQPRTSARSSDHGARVDICQHCFIEGLYTLARKLDAELQDPTGGIGPEEPF